MPPHNGLCSARWWNPDAGYTAEACHLHVLQILDDDEDDAGGAGLAELARQRASALAAQQQAQDGETQLQQTVYAASSHVLSIGA